MIEESNKPRPEWTARYWQWILSFPMEVNPLITGDINEKEFVSLPCTGGGEDCGRRLTLSDGNARKKILIPIFASEYCTAEVANGTDRQLLEKARSVTRPVYMEAIVNGTPIKPFYVETEPFEVRVPANHVLENSKAPPGVYRAVACGYWHVLAPLSDGKHLIVFGGTGWNGFHTKVAYEIKIQQ